MSQRRGGQRETSTEANSELPPFSESLGPIDGPLELDSEEEAKDGKSGDPLSMDERYDIERHNAKVRHWKESPFAVGLVEVTWADECRNGCLPDSGGHRRPAWAREEVDPDTGGCLCCSALLCSRLGAGRVGNFAVLKQSQEWVEEVTEDEETGESSVRRYTRPRLDCILGPYWPMLLFVTYPLILGISGWTLVTALPGKHIVLQFFWGVATLGLIYALAMTAFRDPGILYKRTSPPPQDENSWRWSDAGQTYRPKGSFYDTDTAAVVEEFDHT